MCMKYADIFRSVFSKNERIVVCTDYLLFQPCVAASFEVMHPLLQNHQCSMHHPTLDKSKREVRRKISSTAKFAFECSA